MISSLALLVVTGCVTPETAMQLGRDAAAAKDYVAAETHFERARTSDKFRDEATTELAALYLTQATEVSKGENPEEAIPLYKESIRLNPDSDQARISLGRIYLRMGQYIDAIALLEESASCRGCRSLLSIVYFKSAEQNLADGNYAEASDDFDASVKLIKDPQVALTKVKLYTEGSYGTAKEAVDMLYRASRILDGRSPGQVAVWVAAQKDIITKAAELGDVQGMDDAITAKDPRDLGDGERWWNQVQLRLYAANQQLAHGDAVAAGGRAVKIWGEMGGATEEQRAEVFPQVVSLLQRRVAFHLRGGDRKAAEEVLAQSKDIAPEDLILDQQRAIVAGMRYFDKAKEAVTALDPNEPGFKQAAATAYAEVGMGKIEEAEGPEITAARFALKRAQKVDPDVLEVRLLQAHINANVRVDNLTKFGAETFRDVSDWKYPGNSVRRYGMALAQITFIRAHYDEAAKASVLRGPKFDSRLEALESEIKSFYPFEVELTDSPKAAVVFMNDRDEEIEVEYTIEQGRAKTVKVPPKGETKVEYKQTAYLRYEALGGGKSLFLEPGIAIKAKI